MNRCLRCYKELSDGELSYHSECSDPLFGVVSTNLPYSLEQLIDISQREIAPMPLSVFEPSSATLINQTNNNDDALLRRMIIYPLAGAVVDLTMKLAEVIHIVTAPHALVRIADGSLHYAIRRVDVNDQGVQIPMETICQISELSSEERYEGSYEQLMTLVEECSSVNRIDVINLWEQIIFAWVCGNSDFNLQQIALYEPYVGICLLAPLRYATSHALLDGSQLGVMALSLNGKKRGVVRSDLEAAMRASGLKNRPINLMFKKFVAAKELFMELVDESFVDMDQKESYKKILSTQLKALE